MQSEKCDLYLHKLQHCHLAVGGLNNMKNQQLSATNLCM